MPAQTQPQQNQTKTTSAATKQPVPPLLDPELAAELEADKLAAEVERSKATGADTQLAARDRAAPMNQAVAPFPAPGTPAAVDPNVAALLEQNRLLMAQMATMQSQLAAAMQGAPGALSANAPVPQYVHKNAPSAEMRAQLEQLKAGIWPDCYKTKPQPSPLVPGYSNPPGATQDDAKIEYARVVRWHWERSQNGEKDFVRCWD